MFGYTLIATADLEKLRTRLAAAEDELLLKDRVFQSLNDEHSALTEQHEKLTVEHNILVDLTKDPTTSEGKRSGYHAGKNHFAVVAEIPTEPDATGHSN